MKVGHLNSKSHHEPRCFRTYKEAAEVVSQYCDIIAIRALLDCGQGKDNAETVMAGF
jgi:hypothetical protein